MTIHDNYSLKQLNTFGIDVSAKHFVEITDEHELKYLLSKRADYEEPLLIIGGGSNILFTDNFIGTVIKYNVTGINPISSTEDDILIEASAGETWDNVVNYCVSQNYYGIENLSLIPGNVGAAPIQNIGAYGVELKDVFEYLEGYFIESGEKQLFKKEECGFGYRNSIFKNEQKNKFIITKVILKLSKKKLFNFTYRALNEQVQTLDLDSLSLKDVSNLVRKIRQSKLPDPSKLGNAGSFFKNPEVKTGLYYELKKEFPDLPGFIINEEFYKIPSGWLIEQCGLKGKRSGNVGCYDKQALVIVNYGGADGGEVFSYSQQIKNSVYEKFGIQLEYEVNII